MPATFLCSLRHRDKLSICEPSRKDREQGPRKKLKTMTNLFGKKQEAEAVAVPPTRTLDDVSQPFIVQVKRSLTSDEYMQFLGLMKDFGSEPMKEEQVLKSVVKLFSIKDRDELLKRFKDGLSMRQQQRVEKYREEERPDGQL